MKTLLSIRGAHRLTFGATILILAAHTLLFSTWMIDDAGISFAYARNLVNGYGLVAQPHDAPVEGFSNPTWTLLMAVSYATRTFYLDVTPKLVAFAFVVGALFLIWRDLVSRTTSMFAAWVPLVLVAACTPFVIWTTSGLENALLVFLVVTACRNSIRATANQQSGLRRDIVAGGLAGLLALTRPDAVLYAAAHPVALTWAELNAESRSMRRLVRRVASMMFGFLPVFAAYMTFRVMYFGSLVPNTYYAKQKPALAGVFSPGKLFDLVESATADFAWVIPFFMLFCLGALLFRRRLETRTVVLLSYLSVATAIYLLMPTDWMGEFRFATAYFPLLYWTLADLAVATAQAWPLRPVPLRVFKAAVVVFAAHILIVFASRSLNFAADPPVPLSVVQRFSAEGFNHLASVVQVEEPSVLTPDLGGMLLYSRIKVIDLAGLCDRTIARSLSITGDPSALHGYVFEEVKPTFIHVVGAFVRLSRFHQSDRFLQDYVALHESWDGPPEWADMWRVQGSVVPPFSGDYIRRDALGADPGRLEVLRQEFYGKRMTLTVAAWRARKEGLQAARPLLPAAAQTVYRYLSEPTRTAAGS